MSDGKAVLERLDQLEEKMDSRFDGIEQTIQESHAALLEIAAGHTDSLDLLVKHLGASRAPDLREA